jgi:hypothetical protein
LDTSSVVVAELVMLPLVPVTVTVYAPAGVVLLVVTVRVEEPDPLTDVGLKLPDAPVGNPLTEKLTEPLKPPEAVAVAVKVVELPGVTACELGVSPTEKPADDDEIVRTAAWEPAL